MLGGTDPEHQEEPMTALTRIAFAALLAGCASGGHPTPYAILRHPTTGDVQWRDKPSGAAMALGGAIVASGQGADYAGCKREGKGYTWLDATAKLPPADQQRYEEERAALRSCRF
jgi:hypothetical protein